MRVNQWRVLPFSLMMLSLLAPSVNADSVQLNFTGSILAGTCSVDTASKNQSVAMGDVGTIIFSSPGDRSPAQTFSIVLSCEENSPTGATVTFSGATATGDATLLALDSGTDATTGVAIVLSDKEGNKIDLGSASSVYSLAEASANEMQFNAQYVSLVERGAITAGKANATAQFTINYP
ncbi:fimbrial protein [Kluyvera sp. CHPC 1.251]|uniref:fimbrial protein n=1 Tax=Kluyvera sp. CHPC 1.251 TaxID=2995175 RepID=UPI002FD81267